MAWPFLLLILGLSALISGQRHDKLPQAATAATRRKLQQETWSNSFLDKGTSLLDASTMSSTSGTVVANSWANANNKCSLAHSILPGDLVQGILAAAPQGDSEDFIQNCIGMKTNGQTMDTDVAAAGLWYSVEGTGNVLKASLVFDHDNGDNDGMPQMAISEGTEGSCDALQCSDMSFPFLATNSIVHHNSDNNNNGNRVSSGWTTYWSSKPSVMYYLYVYGPASAKVNLILLDQRRPHNDQHNGAVELQVGDVLEGSFAYASSDNNNKSNNCSTATTERNNVTLATERPGVWFKVNGTGSLLLANIKTVVPVQEMQVSIHYAKAMDCVDYVSHSTVVDPTNSSGYTWYPLSMATVWESVLGETYYVYVQGPNTLGEYNRGNFELTVLQKQRPGNDHCSSATDIVADATDAGSTTLATTKDDFHVCSSSGESKLTSPGVWYQITGQQGLHQISVTSNFAAGASIFTGSSCLSLECVGGSYTAFSDGASFPSTSTATVTFDANKEQTYYILVHGKDSMVGGFDLSVSNVNSLMGSNSTNHEESNHLYTVETPAALSIGFFPGSSAWKNITNPDLDALMDQVNKFYSKVLLETFAAEFVRFEATMEGFNVEVDNALPVTVFFNMKVALQTSDEPPSPGTVLNIMAEGDYQEFIRNYVWKSAPLGFNAFSDTLRVEFERHVSSLSISQNDTVSKVEDNVARVDAMVIMSFTFLPDTQLRAPTEVELDGLRDETIAFYRRVFFEIYDNFVKLGLQATSSKYVEGADKPVQVHFAVRAFFSKLTNSSSISNNMPTASDILAVMQNVELSTFVEKYVWESQPFGDNIFYNTRRVSLTNGGGLNSSNTSSSTAISTSTVITSVHGEPRRISVHVALSFDFHETATQTLRKPRKEELDGLMNVTQRFFKELLQNELPENFGFIDLQFFSTSMEYRKLRAFPVTVYTQVDVFVRDDPDSKAPVLSKEQVLALMETANMADYVEFYVWFAEPSGSSVFFAVDQAVLEPFDPSAYTEAENTGGASTSSNSCDGSLSLSPNQQITLKPVETDITAQFTFAPGSNHNQNEKGYRIATTEELAALTDQTKAYFTKVLNDAYGDLVQLGISLITAGFAEDNKSCVVAWKVSAVFRQVDDTTSSRTPEHLQSILTMADTGNYIHHYVWSSAPMGTNMFFNTASVQFEQQDADLSANSGVTSSTVPTATDAPDDTNAIIVHASILYGFLEDQFIRRSPNSNEEESIRYQTSLFFNKLFRREFGTSFTTAAITIQDVTLVQDDELPIIINYKIDAKFKKSTSIPSSDDLFQVLESADFESYIEFYVWNADSAANNMFFDTQEVVFQATIEYH